MTDKKTTVADDVEDLDELLDEVLDDFSKPPSSSSGKPSSTTAPLSSSSTPAPTSNGPDAPELELGDEELARRLQASVEELMKDEDKFRERFQAMLNLDEPTDSSSSASFADKINNTMNKLKESSEEVDAAVEDSSNDAMLAEIMSHMEKMADNEELHGEIGNMLEKFMDQLTSKELLYEPMKELASQYPKWLDENRATKGNTEDFSRYERQSEIVHRIVTHFEDPDYDHENEQQSKVIMDLIEEMQKLGQPPEEMLGEFAPQLANLQSLDDNNDGLPPDVLDQCTQM